MLPWYPTPSIASSMYISASRPWPQANRTRRSCAGTARQPWRPGHHPLRVHQCHHALRRRRALGRHLENHSNAISASSSTKMSSRYWLPARSKSSSAFAAASPMNRPSKLAFASQYRGKAVISRLELLGAQVKPVLGLFQVAHDVAAVRVLEGNGGCRRRHFALPPCLHV
ncbi:hypothetical protein BC828DRAFT_250075 [Blastocladiella britannica]|nr:hypothetical protein BC828DRAFT_250075 [Blastocladiella britannica]